MLGKGLESLIPKNGGQGQNPEGEKPVSPPGSQPAPSSQPVQPAQPSSSSSSQQEHPVQEHREQSHQQPQPHYQPHPGFVPPASPVQSISPVQPIKKEEGGQSSSIFQIELDRITPNPDQPRRNFDQDALRELAGSIREFGLLQPIVVSKIEKETPTGIAVEYQIIAGERRYLAAKMLGLPRLPAIVRNISLEREKLELGVIENIQRENLNPIEAARAFQRLQEEFRMTQREIAAKLGKSREVVANAVRLLDLPEYIQKAVEQGEVSESNARLLIPIDDPATQKKLLEDIIQNKLTTRDVRVRVDSALAAVGVRRRGRPPLQEVHLAPEVKAMQEELSTSLGAPVEISKNATNGKITITFFSEEELKNILEKLKNERGEERF